MCYTMDGAMNFVYQKPFGALDAENFDSDYLVPIVDFVSTLQWAIYFPRTFEKIFKLTDMLPERALERWLKGFVTTKEMLKVNREFSIFRHLPFITRSQHFSLPNESHVRYVYGESDPCIICRTLKQDQNIKAFANLRPNDIEMQLPNQTPPVSTYWERSPSFSLRHHPLSKSRKGTVHPIRI